MTMCVVPSPDLIEQDIAFIVRECERMRDAALEQTAKERKHSSAALH